MKMKKFLTGLLLAVAALAMWSSYSPVNVKAADSDYTYQIIDSANCVITRYTGSETDLVIPDTINGYAVKEIGDSAFYENYDLTSVTIPDSVTRIGYDAFYGLYNLTNVVIGENVEEIGSNAFYGCALTSVFIPERVTSIGGWAFKNQYLEEYNVDSSNVVYESVDGVLFTKGQGELIDYPESKGDLSYNVPNAVTKIEDYAFAYNRYLETLIVGENVEEISAYTFYSIGALREYIVEASNAVYESANGTLFTKGQTELIRYPQGREDISYSVPNTVIKIRDLAFDGSYKLTNVEIGENVEEIGYAVFSGCYGITSVSIPENVSNIALYAFQGMYNLEEYNVAQSNAVYESSDGVLFSKGQTELISYPCAKSGLNYNISDSVTKIGQSAFQEARNLTNVEIGENVEEISGSAFQYCNTITSISIPENVSVIADYAFGFMYNLEEFNVAPENSAYESADGILFTKGQTELIQYPIAKTDLSTYNVPDTASLIKSHAFYNNQSLASVFVPESVVEIWGGVFEGMSEGFTMFGIVGSYAEQYADTYADIYGFIFEPVVIERVTLETDDTTAVAKINVFGLAPIGYTVTVYDNDTPVATFVANSASRWHGVITLGEVFDGPTGQASPTPTFAPPTSQTEVVDTPRGQTDSPTPTFAPPTSQTEVVNTPIGQKDSPTETFAPLSVQARNVNDGRIHEIKAEITTQLGLKVSATKTVLYSATEPSLEQFVMRHDGQTINMITTDGLRQTLIFRGERSFTFEIKIANSENVNKLYVASLREDEKKRIEAMYDSNGDIFIASGYFDPRDRNYVPGEIFIEYEKNNSDDIFTLGTSKGAYRVAIDPSGYVYEAVPTNRLSGVKATVYYKDSENGSAVEWNALEWDQMNPVYTDMEGRYAWDVPEGLWQVKYELEGYETAHSDWMTVPPPQTDVNIGLVSLAAPTVVWVSAYESGVELEFSKYMKVSTVLSEINIGAAGSVTAVGEENGFAKVFRFTPTSPLTVGNSVNVSVGASVECYAGIRLAQAYSQSAEVKIEARSLDASDVTLNYAENAKNISVKVLPENSAAGKTVTAVSQDDHIVQIAPSAVVGANGTATFQVTPKLPGETKIKFLLENSSLVTEIQVTVSWDGTPKQTFILGDCNNDLAVNPIDVAYLARALAKWEGYTVKSPAADVNKDGAVNPIDAAYLARHLAKWEGYPLD